MLWSVVIFKAKLSTFFVHLTFFSFSLFSTTFHLSPPPSFFPSGILQQVYLSRSFLLPLPHCLLVLWCFNRWINDCFYFHSVPGQYKLLCSPARVRDRIWETNRQKKERERNIFGRRFCSVWHCHWAVSQQLNIFAYLSGYWRVKRHSSTPSSPSSPHPQHTHSLWTWQLHFISSSALCSLLQQCLVYSRL